MTVDWWRSWHGAPTDAKWLVIAKKTGLAPGVVSAIVWALFDCASQAEERGCVEDFDIETYSVWSGFPEADIAKVIAALHDKRVIDAAHRFAAWADRQPEREDSSAERTREWRKRKRANGEHPDPSHGDREKRRGDDAVTQGDARVTHGDAHVTQSDAPESDSDTDSDSGRRSPGASARPRIREAPRLDGVGHALDARTDLSVFKDHFQRGKEVLGVEDRPLLFALLRRKGNVLPKARAVLEYAMAAVPEARRPYIMAAVAEPARQRRSSVATRQAEAYAVLDRLDAAIASKRETDRARSVEASQVHS
jgi:hypothetical protein